MEDREEDLMHIDEGRGIEVSGRTREGKASDGQTKVRLKSIELKSAERELHVPLSKVTLLVGRHGAGKTEVLLQAANLMHQHGHLVQEVCADHGDVGASIFDVIEDDDLFRNNDLLFMDDFGANMHHSAMKDLWHRIWECSDEYRCQVLASTHSLDCVKGMLQGMDACAADMPGDMGSMSKPISGPGKLIRLVAPKDIDKDTADFQEVIAYSMDQLRSALNQRLEVR